MTEVDNRNIIASSDEISLKDVILTVNSGGRYLRSKWIIILMAALTGGLLGFAYWYLKKPVFRAELSFALQDNNSSGSAGGSAAGLASQFGLDLGGSAGGAFSGDNIIELMKSRSMVENALLTTIEIKGKQQTLATLYFTFNKLRERWSSNPQLNNIQFLPGADRSKFTLQQDSVLGVFCLEILKSNLTVEKEDKKLDIISIKVRSKNELFSKYFAEALAKTVSDFYVDTKTKRSVQNVSVLQHQTDSVRIALNNAIVGVASSSDVNPNANPSLQILKVQSQHHEVDVEANKAILGELVKNLEASKVSLRKETPLIQIIDTPILPLEVEKLGKLTVVFLGVFLASFFTAIFLLIRRSAKKLMD